MIDGKRYYLFFLFSLIFYALPTPIDFLFKIIMAISFVMEISWQRRYDWTKCRENNCDILRKRIYEKKCFAFAHDFAQIRPRLLYQMISTYITEMCRRVVRETQETAWQYDSMWRYSNAMNSSRILQFGFLFSATFFDGNFAFEGVRIIRLKVKTFFSGRN